MATATKLSQGVSFGDTTSVSKDSSKFSIWCEKLEKSRFMVVSGLLFFQGCVIVPVLLLLIQFYDLGISNITALIASLSTMGVLVANISGLGMKTNIIIFALNFIVMLSLILIHVVSI